MAALLDEIDFSDKIEEEPHLQQHIGEQRDHIGRKIYNEGYEKPAPVFEVNFTKQVIVANLPEIPAEKVPVLTKVLCTVFNKAGCPILAENLYMPLANRKGQKCAFITFDDEETAITAMKKVNGFQLDKAHKLIVVTFDEMQRLMQTPDEYVQPNIFSQVELKNWLLDDQARDQFVVRYKDKTKVFWNDALIQQPQLVSKGPEGRVWTEKFIRWSPQGTYLATAHQNGIVIWGGPGFQEIRRFEHYNVSDLEFSPCENYLLTYSARARFSVWSVLTGEEKRRFAYDETSEWADFKWSFDGNYIARKGKEIISVYNSVDMTMILDDAGNKQSITIPNLELYSWGTSRNIIAYFAKGQEQKPAQIRIINIPNRQIIASKLVFDVLGVTLHWQLNGDYLAAHVLNSKKSKKNASKISSTPKSSTIEIFHLRHREIPVESKQQNIVISSLSWEPYGNRLAVLIGSSKQQSANALRSLEIYEISNHQTKLMDVVEVSYDNVSWAPQGGHFVVFSKVRPSAEGNIQFYSIQNQVVYFVAQTSHSSLNQVEWDPSGRYLISGGCVPLQPGAQIRAISGVGYNIWSCQGDFIYQKSTPGFYQVMWRPRPKVTVNREQQAEIERTLEVKGQEYRNRDIEVEKRRDREAKRKEKEQLSTFNRLYEEGLQYWEETRAEREAIQGCSDEALSQRWVKEFGVVQRLHMIKTEKVPMQFGQTAQNQEEET